MIQVTSKNGVVNLESTLAITEGVCGKIKANPDRVKAFLKEMRIEHFLAVTEDGAITSKIGEQMPPAFDPVDAATDLVNKHKAFIDWASDLPVYKEDVEVEATKEEAIAEEAPGESIDHQDEDEDDDDKLFGFFIIPMCI